MLLDPHSAETGETSMKKEVIHFTSLALYYNSNEVQSYSGKAVMLDLKSHNHTNTPSTFFFLHHFVLTQLWCESICNVLSAFVLKLLCIIEAWSVVFLQ